MPNNERIRTANQKQRTSNAELIVAGGITAVAVTLHLLYLTHAGPLWRDEAGGVAVAMTSSLGDLWHSLTHDSFPVLFPLLVRGWTGIGLVNNDFGLRCLGFLIGMSLLIVLWRSAREFGCKTPLISLGLLGTNLAVVQWGDSLRGYGLGSVMAALCISETWKLARRPGLRQFMMASAAGTLSVQCLYQNAFLLLALCLSAFIVCTRRKQGRAAWLVIGSGLPAAVSLLPYVRPLIHAQQWWIVEKAGFNTALAWSTLSEAMATPPILGIVAWVVVVIATCGLGITRLGRRVSEEKDSREDIGLYAGLAAIAGSVGFLVFVANAGLPTQPWYWLSWLAFMAVCGQAAFGRKLARYGRRGVVATGVLAGLAFVTSVVPVTERMTNIDQIAAHLEKNAGPNDLIVVYPWYCGVSFNRYYKGTTPWKTIPELEDHRFHRYDLLKIRLQQVDALRVVHETIRRTLQSGSSVWLVGGLPPPVRGEQRAPVLPPAPEGPQRWFDEPYNYSWGRQTAEFIETTAGTTETVPLPEGRFMRYENAPLFKASGPSRIAL